jgi:hypothetical protein
MKPSHYTTPRTLSACYFEQGYTSRIAERSHARCDLCIAILAVAVCAAIAFGVL